MGWHHVLDCTFIMQPRVSFLSSCLANILPLFYAFQDDRKILPSKLRRLREVNNGFHYKWTWGPDHAGSKLKLKWKRNSWLHLHFIVPVVLFFLILPYFSPEIPNSTWPAGVEIAENTRKTQPGISMRLLWAYWFQNWDQWKYIAI